MTIGDYNKIMADRKLFNKTVYTPMSEALRLLDERRKDPELMAKIEKLLNGDIPEILKNKKCGVLFRQIATPNKENKYFIDITTENGLRPIFFEYFDDKFTSNNEYKHSLGQLRISSSVNKNGNYLVEKINIMDFNKNNGKKFKEIKTFWGEPLVDFHKKLFGINDYSIKNIDFYEASNWFKENGGKAIDYYTNFFLLFTCFGILFENFLISKDSESNFTKKVVLPSLEKVLNITGIKPLIVPLEPLDLEEYNFWYNHLQKVKSMIPNHKYD
jgi:hypothetical protein